MRLLAFDDVVIDVENHQIRKDGSLLDLEPKSFRVLLYLVEHTGRVVPKEELLNEVWSGTIVSENALTRVIGQIRKALQDDPKQPRYIETVPTIGYRFIGLVTMPEGESASTVSPTPQALPAVPEAPERRINWWVPAGVLAAIAIAWAVPWFRQRAADPGEALRSIQFTGSAGLELHPTFSPDGSGVAFTSDRTGHFEIYVRQVGAGGSEIAITRDGKENLEPAWSPDGSQIAYYCGADRSIYVVSSLGGMPRKLTSFGSQPVWSPDGRTIAFRSEALVSVAIAELPPATASTIWLIPASGGSPEALTTANHPLGHHSEPVFSTDGKRLAFTSYYGLKNASIWEMNLEKRTYWEMPIAHEIAYNPAYGPDGLYCLAVTGRDSVSIFRWAGSRDPQQLARYDFALLRDLTIRGSRLAYVVSGHNSNLWLLENGAMRALTDETYVRLTQPVFSPDGTRIAHLTRMKGNLSDIWVRNSDGSNAIQISRNANEDYMPSWLPDSKGIVYTARSGPQSVLRQFSLADGTERILAELGVLKSLGRLSPDATKLAYSRFEGGATNVWTLDVKSGKHTQLTFGKDWVSYPVWSRSGSQLAVEEREGEDVHLATVPSAGGALRQVTNARGQVFVYSFSPGDGAVAAAANWDGPWNLYSIEIATGKATRLTDNTLMRVFYRYPDWSPDGKVLVFERNETRGNIFLGELPGS